MDRGDNSLWALVRQAYEGDELRLSEICEHFGVTPAELAARRKAEGWVTRTFRWRPGQAKRTEPAAPVLDRNDLVRRLYRAIETELTIIEERMADKDNRSPADSERDTRSIGALIRNLEKLTEFDGGQAEGRGRRGAGGGDGGGAAGITADEADRIRRDLAARIERLTTR